MRPSDLYGLPAPYGLSRQFESYGQIANALVDENIAVTSIADFMLISFSFVCLTSQITGGKKQSDEGAALFDVRVHLPC